MKNTASQYRLCEEDQTKDLNMMVEIAMMKEASIKATADVEVHMMGKSIKKNKEASRKSYANGTFKRQLSIVATGQNTGKGIRIVVTLLQ